MSNIQWITNSEISFFIFQHSLNQELNPQMPLTTIYEQIDIFLFNYVKKLTAIYKSIFTIENENQL